MMSVSEFFSSDPEPPWIIDVAAELERYTDIHTHNEASTSTATATTTTTTTTTMQQPSSLVSMTNLDSRTVTDMEIDIPSTSSESRIDRVIAHLFTLRDIESVRPFRIEDHKFSTGGGRRRAAGRSNASRKRKFSQIE